VNGPRLGVGSLMICTENYVRMAEFYKSIFGMKKITYGMTDATGNYNPERGQCRLFDANLVFRPGKSIAPVISAYTYLPLSGSIGNCYGFE
jgi:hypothetical protein